MIKAIIIEDDLIWKNKLVIMLEYLKVGVSGIADSVSTASELISKHKTDLIIADVNLGNQKIFELYNKNVAFCTLPTIFLTQSDNEIDYASAKKVTNHLYLVKPVHKLSLKSAIDMLCKNNIAATTNNTLSIKGKFNQVIKLPFEKILFIKQTQHYSTIHTAVQQFVIKKSLSNLLKELDSRFMQIHRSYCVNKDFIDNFGLGLECIKIGGNDIPIGLTFKDDIKKVISANFSIK